MSNIEELGKIFVDNKDKRICVLGTTCTGKTTLINESNVGVDMDEEIFPLLTDEENDDIKEIIKKELEQSKEFKIYNIKIIKMSYYYSVFFKIDVNNNIKINDYLKIEKKIKQQIRKKNKKIKFIDVESL